MLFFNIYAINAYKTRALKYLVSVMFQLDIQCIKIHPEADVTNTLANNVAVLKLDVPTIQSSKTVSDVISLKQAQLTPANQPEAIATGQRRLF